MNRLKRSKNFRSAGLFLSTICFLLLSAFMAGDLSGSKFHSQVNEDPAVAKGEGEIQQESRPLPMAWKDIKKVVVIILENADVDVALSLPNFSKLAKKGALLANYYGITHPSQPNYISLISGSTQGVVSDEKVNLPMRHIGDLLESEGKSWKAYGEDYPGNCFLEMSSHNYVRKHMPFLSFENVQRDRRRCNQVVPAQAFSYDLANSLLADFSLFIPNQRNNGHDTSVEYADHWLGETMIPLLEERNPDSDILFIVTFDEGSMSGDNRIYTVLFGAGIQAGVVSTHNYSHFSLLKTIEMIFGIPSLGLNDSKASYISDVWKSQ